MSAKGSPRTPSHLARRLSGVCDLAIGRAALIDHLSAAAPADFAADLDDLARSALDGVDAARDAMVVIASFLAHFSDEHGQAALATLVSAAADGELDLASTLLGGRAPTRSLPPGARLAEVGVATYAAISGLRSRRDPAESQADWNETQAYLRRSPASRAAAMRPLVERLRRHHDPILVGRLLDQRWLRASDVVGIASRRPTVPALQLAIAVRDRWLQHTSVRRALAENPYTPSGLALALRSTVPASTGWLLRRRQPLRSSVPRAPLIAGSRGVVILGAGLAGLAASAHLRKRGVPHRTFERAAHPGGHATTLAEQGFRFDRTGHLLHLRDEALRAEVCDWLGESLLTIDRRSVVWSHGVTTRYPFQANLHGLPPEVAASCLLGYLRARDAHRADPDAPPPATFEAFVLRHFGEGIAEHFMVPYNQKLWGVHPRELSSAWTGRFVPLPKLEDVVFGAVGARAPELGYNARFFYPRLGIGELTEALADRAGPLDLRCAARRIELRSRVVELESGERVPFGPLVSTLPLPALVERIADAPEGMREAARRLRCTHLWYLDLALHGPPETSWHWAYVPDPAIPFYRVGSYSAFSAAMAPPGAGSLYVELASREPPDLRELLPEIARHLVAMGVISSPERIRFARARRIDSAYVVFDHHHDASVRRLLSWLAGEGVRSTGRYGAFTYASMEDAMLMGREAGAWAEQVGCGGA